MKSIIFRFVALMAIALLTNATVWSQEDTELGELKTIFAGSMNSELMDTVSYDIAGFDQIFGTTLENDLANIEANYQTDSAAQWLEFVASYTDVTARFGQMKPMDLPTFHAAKNTWYGSCNSGIVKLATNMNNLIDGIAQLEKDAIMRAKEHVSSKIRGMSGQPDLDQNLDLFNAEMFRLTRDIDKKRLDRRGLVRERGTKMKALFTEQNGGVVFQEFPQAKGSSKLGVVSFPESAQ